MDNVQSLETKYPQVKDLKMKHQFFGRTQITVKMPIYHLQNKTSWMPLIFGNDSHHTLKRLFQKLHQCMELLNHL